MDNWLICLTKEEKMESFEVFFTFFPNKVLVILSNNLSLSKHSSFTCEEIILLIKKILKQLKTMFSFFTRQEDRRNKFLMDEFVSSLCSLPDRVINVKKGTQMEPFNPPQNFFKLISVSLMEEMITSEEDFSDFFVSLTSKVVRLGYSDTLCDILLENLEYFKSKEKKLESLRSCFSKTPTAVYENILRVIAKKLQQKEGEEIEEILRNIFGSKDISVTNKQFLTFKVLINEDVNATLLNCIANFLHSVDDNFLVQACKNVVQVWSEEEFLKKNTPERQKQLSIFLLICIEKLDRDALQSFSEYFMVGTQHRLESVISQVRRFGMLIAEKFSNKTSVLKEDKKLKFDDSDDFSDLMELAGIFRDKKEEIKVEIEKEEVAKIDSKEVSKSKKRREMVKKIIKKEESEEEENPDDLFFKKESESEEEEESEERSATIGAEEDSEEELKPLNLEDDQSDLASVKLPVFLKDCFVGLTSNHEHVDRLEGSLR